MVLDVMVVLHDVDAIQNQRKQGAEHPSRDHRRRSNRIKTFVQSVFERHSLGVMDTVVFSTRRMGIAEFRDKYLTICMAS